LSIIRNTRKHNISETGSVPIIRWGERDNYSVGSHSPHLKTETDPVSETLVFRQSEFRAIDKVQKHSDFKCYTPSSEPFRFYFYGIVFQQSFEMTKEQGSYFQTWIKKEGNVHCDPTASEN
jgi:hypothetical protein